MHIKKNKKSNDVIIFLLPNFSGGGAERVAINLFLELYKRGHHIELIVFNDDGPLRTLIPKNVPIHSLEVKSLRKSIFKLIRKIRSLSPKIIFTTFGYINIVIIIMRSLFFRDTNVWIREANLPSISLPNNNYHLAIWIGYRFIYRYADRVFCSSKRMKSEFLYNFHIPSSILFLLPNPVNELYIRDNAKKVLRDKGEGVRFVAVGRLVYQKGFDILLELISEFKDTKIKLRIIGDGPLYSKLQEKINNLKISEQVILSGYCENPWQWIAGADALLITSRWEGMPNVALESLACGTMVIATDSSGGISEICSQTIGNIFIANSRSDFLKKMQSVKPRCNVVISKSILPKENTIGSVTRLFEHMLD